MKAVLPLITYLLNQATARFWGTKASDTQPSSHKAQAVTAQSLSSPVPGIPSTESTKTFLLLQSQLTHHLLCKPGLCRRRRPAPHQALRFSEAGCVPAGNLPAGLYFYWPKTDTLCRILQSLAWQLVFKISDKELFSDWLFLYNMQNCFYF